jgi:hypothetical protein
MQSDYTFALEVSESTSQVQQRIVQALSYPARPGCLVYSSKQPERLIKLAHDLSILAASSPELALSFLADLVASNLGRVRNLSAASRGPFRLCGTSLTQLVGKCE